MDAARLIIATALPWIVGAALVDALTLSGRESVSGRLAWIAGAGWYLGALLSTLVLRASSAIGVHFDFGWLCALFALAGGMAIARRRRVIQAAPTIVLSAARELVGHALIGKTRVLWLLLMAWLVGRMILLATEVGTRPLYPWDAWTVWATKARVFDGVGALVPFVDATRWLAANGAAWFDAQPAAFLTVPLLQTWSALAIGRWDDVLVNWPWWFAAVALALAVFGSLRMIGSNRLPALVTVWLVMSLPLLDVHVALAGYPDLFVAALLTLAASSLLLWAQKPTTRQAIQVAVFGAALLLIKPVATLWMVGLVTGAAVAAWPKYALRGLAVAIAVLAFVAALVSRTETQLTNAQWQLVYRPAANKTVESLLLLGNWHLLFYGIAGMALIARRYVFAPAIAPLTAIVIVGTVYIAALTMFPSARFWFGDATTLNEAALQFAPVATLWLVLALSAWSERFVQSASTLRRSPTSSGHA